MPLVRRKKAPEPTAKTLDSDSSKPHQDDDDDNNDVKNSKAKGIHRSSKSNTKPKWNCLDSCCWLVGCICTTWWFLLFLYNAMPASFPQYVTEAITGPMPDPPGVKLSKEGLKAKHSVVFVPGIVTGGLELWEGRQCAEGLFRKRLWGWYLWRGV